MDLLLWKSQVKANQLVKRDLIHLQEDASVSFN